MIWLLAVLLSCVTVSAEICNVTLLPGQVLQPKPSWDNGAKFRSHIHTETKEDCQEGCCGVQRCDTILFTGSKVDRKGDNCFYFDCHDRCIFRDSTPQESNYSVAVVAQSPAHQDLPDFSNIFVSSKPESADQKDNSTESHQAADPPVEPQKVATPASNTQPAENKAQSNSSASSEQQQSENKLVDPPVKTQNTTAKDAAVKVTTEKDAAAKDTTAKETTAKDTTAKPDVPATPKVEKNNAVDTVPGKNEAGQPTQPSSPIANEPVTVKDNAEKPETGNVTPVHEAAKPDTVKPAAAKPATGKEDATPTEKPKPKLPNEVPPVTVKVVVSKGNATESKAGVEEQSKTESKKTKKPAAVVVDKAGEKKDKSDETKPANNVSVEVDIHTIQSKDPDTYTKKDVVFWVAVVGGSALIVLGLVIVVRYYGNKRRRLYSSLTDDYLINGMYSI